MSYYTKPINMLLMLEYGCETCSASPGEACTTRTGQSTTWHSARWLAWAHTRTPDQREEDLQRYKAQVDEHLLPDYDLSEKVLHPLAREGHSPYISGEIDQTYDVRPVNKWLFDNYKDLVDEAIRRRISWRQLVITLLERGFEELTEENLDDIEAELERRLNRRDRHADE